MRRNFCKKPFKWINRIKYLQKMLASNRIVSIIAYKGIQSGLSLRVYLYVVVNHAHLFYVILLRQINGLQLKFLIRTTKKKKKSQVQAFFNQQLFPNLYWKEWAKTITHTYIYTPKQKQDTDTYSSLLQYIGGWNTGLIATTPKKKKEKKTNFYHHNKV